MHRQPLMPRRNPPTSTNSVGVNGGIGRRSSSHSSSLSLSSHRSSTRRSSSHTARPPTSSASLSSKHASPSPPPFSSTATGTTTQPPPATASSVRRARVRRSANWRPRLSFQPTDEFGEPILPVPSPNGNSNGNDNDETKQNSDGTTANPLSLAINITRHDGNTNSNGNGGSMIMDPLAQRKQLASSMVVVNEINRFWAVFEKMYIPHTDANQPQLPYTGSPNEINGVVIGRDEFIHMHMAISRACTAPPYRFMASYEAALTDWRHATRHLEVGGITSASVSAGMDYMTFASHLFDVADLYCPATHARAYATWLQVIFDLICCSNQDNYGVVSWRRLNYVPIYGISDWMDRFMADMSALSLPYDPLASPLPSSTPHSHPNQQHHATDGNNTNTDAILQSHQRRDSTDSAVSAYMGGHDRRYSMDGDVPPIDQLDLATVGSPLYTPGGRHYNFNRLTSPSKHRTLANGTSVTSPTTDSRIPAHMRAAIAHANRTTEEKNFDPDHDAFHGKFQPPPSTSILPVTSATASQPHHDDTGGEDWLVNTSGGGGNKSAGRNRVQRPLVPLSQAAARALYQRRLRLRTAAGVHGHTSLTLAATPDLTMRELANLGDDDVPEALSYTMDDILRTEQAMTQIERRINLRRHGGDNDDNGDHDVFKYSTASAAHSRHTSEHNHPFDIPLSPAPNAPPYGHGSSTSTKWNNKTGVYGMDSPDGVGPLPGFNNKRRSHHQQSHSGSGNNNSATNESGRLSKTHSRTSTGSDSSTYRINGNPWASTSGHLVMDPADRINLGLDDDEQDSPKPPAPVVPRVISAEQQAEQDRALRARVMARVAAQEHEKETRRLSMSSNNPVMVAMGQSTPPSLGRMGSISSTTGSMTRHGQSFTRPSDRHRALSQKWSSAGGNDSKTAAVLQAMRTLPARRAFAALYRVKARLHQVFQTAWYNFRYDLTPEPISTTPAPPSSDGNTAAPLPLPSPSSPLIDQLVPSRRRRLLTTIATRRGIRYDHDIVLLLDRFWLLFDNNLDGITRHQYVNFYMMAYRATFQKQSYYDRLDVLEKVADGMWRYDNLARVVAHGNNTGSNTDKTAESSTANNEEQSQPPPTDVLDMNNDDNGSSRQRLAYQPFCDSLFEFVDAWCGTANVADYRHFLNQLYAALTMEPNEPSSSSTDVTSNISRSPSPPTNDKDNSDDVSSAGFATLSSNHGQSLLPRLRAIGDVTVGPLIDTDQNDTKNNTNNDDDNDDGPARAPVDDHYLSLPRLLSGHEREMLLNIKWGSYLSSLQSAEGGISREERITAEFQVRRDAARAIAAAEDTRAKEQRMIRATTIHHLLAKHPKRHAHLIATLDKKMKAAMTATANQLRATEALLNKAMSAQLAALPPMSFRQVYAAMQRHYLPAIGDPQDMMPPPAIIARQQRADALVALSRELTGMGSGGIGMATDRLVSSRAVTPMIIGQFRHEEQYALHRGLVQMAPNDAWQQLLMPEDMDAAKNKIVTIITRLQDYRMDTRDRIRWTQTRDSESRTPLHLAIIIGDQDAALTLMQYGMDVNARDMWGLRAIDYALQAGSMELIESLEHVGAASLTVHDVITMLNRSDLPLQPMYGVRVLQQMAADGHTVNHAAQLILTICQMKPSVLSEQYAADLVETFSHRAKLDLKWLLHDQLSEAEPAALAAATALVPPTPSSHIDDSGDFESRPTTRDGTSTTATPRNAPVAATAATPKETKTTDAKGDVDDEETKYPVSRGRIIAMNDDNDISNNGTLSDMESSRPTTRDGALGLLSPGRRRASIAMMVGDVDLNHAALSWRLSLLLVRLIRQPNLVIRGRLIALIRQQGSTPAAIPVQPMSDIKSEVAFSHMHEPAMQQYQTWLAHASHVERQFGAPAPPMPSPIPPSTDDEEDNGTGEETTIGEPSDVPPLSPLPPGITIVPNAGPLSPSSLSSATVTPGLRTPAKTPGRRRSGPASPLKSATGATTNPRRASSSVSGWRQNQADTPLVGATTIVAEPPLPTTTTAAMEIDDPSEDDVAKIAEDLARATERATQRAAQRQKIAQLRSDATPIADHHHRNHQMRAPLSAPRDHTSPEMIYTHARPSRIPRPFFPASSTQPLPIKPTNSEYDDDDANGAAYDDPMPPIITSSDIMHEHNLNLDGLPPSPKRHPYRMSGKYNDADTLPYRPLPTVHLPQPSQDAFTWPYDIADEFVAEAMITGDDRTMMDAQRLIAAHMTATADAMTAATAAMVSQQQQPSPRMSKSVATITTPALTTTATTEPTTPSVAISSSPMFPAIRTATNAATASSTTPSLVSARPVLISLPPIGASSSSSSSTSSMASPRTAMAMPSIAPPPSSSGPSITPLPAATPPSSYHALTVPPALISQLPDDHPLSFALRIGQASTAVRFGVAKYQASRIPAASLLTHAPVHAPGTAAAAAYGMRITSMLPDPRVAAATIPPVIDDTTSSSNDMPRSISSVDWSRVRALYREPISASFTYHQLRHRLHSVQPHTLAFPHSRQAPAALTTTEEKHHHHTTAPPQATATTTPMPTTTVTTDSSSSSSASGDTDTKEAKTTASSTTPATAATAAIHATLPLFQSLPIPRPPVTVRRTRRTYVYAMTGAPSSYASSTIMVANP